MSVIIRKIEPTDNPIIEQVIKSVFLEFKLPLTGTAYADMETSSMYESYQQKGAVYFVLTEKDTVLGGGGIKTLNHSDNSVCELRKMYLDPGVRGKGYGRLLLESCLDFAREAGYKQCYLETLPELQTAIHLYEKKGFKHTNTALGSTGHSSCNIWMIKTLNK